MGTERGLHMTHLDLLTVLSYIALNVDILFQIERIHKTKSSRDLSLIGMSIRYAAIFIILIKFVSLTDLPLIIGQALILLTYTTYLALAVYYLVNRPPHTSV
jgi:hypothetical protein